MDKFIGLLFQESYFFAATCEMMLHTKVKDGRRFLCAMNYIVDYYYEKKPVDGINYHIIYLPTCPEWARELLVRFLIHKTAFSDTQKFLAIAKKKTTGASVIPEGLSSKHKQFKQIIAEKNYYNKFIQLFKSFSDTPPQETKSLFVVQDKDVTTKKQDKNPWLEQLYSTDLVNSNENTIVTNTFTAYDIEDIIRQNRDNVPNIENIFIFHSQNRGKITNSYNIDQLNRLNQYGLGVKNCFVFYVSEQPFRLYYAKDNIKTTLSGNLLNQEIKRFDDFDGFITFSPNELDLMFQRPSLCSQFVVDPDDREIFTADIDSYLDELPHNYRLRNALSFAFTDKARNCFMIDFESETGTWLPETGQQFINYYKQIFNEEIYPRILSRIGEYHTVAFVIPPGMSSDYKDALRKTFSSDSRKIVCKDYNQLRDGLNEECIILFPFRYTDERYKSFPNSFDPLPLKGNQHGLTIVNRLTHNRYYEWNKHFYEKDFNGLLYSMFRIEQLGWSKKILQKPVLPDILNDIDEAESDAREYMAERCTIVFENSKTKKLAADRVLYHNGKHYCISSLKELPFEDGIEIQLLDELVNQIKENLIKKTDNNLKSEGYIRRDPTFRLTEEQISSNIELWKYLLKRKVDELGIEATYEAIFPINKDISLKGFEKWTDYEYPMILPRSRKCQNSLLSFLGFKIGSPYHRVVLTKKLLKNNNTRLLNSQIESLLQSILTVPSVNEESFDEIFDEHSEILTLLEINNAADVNALVDLLEINLKPVKEIIYDSNKA